MNVGREILFVATIAYLSDAFERCLNICQTNFSSLANSIVFEGNILRLKALCLLKLHQQKTEQIHQLEQSEII